MIFGNFKDDLNQYLLENKGQLGASKVSMAAILDIGQPGKGLLEQGKMYAFRYFTDDETFYDTYPIVIGLGQSPINTNQLGINLHYIPYEARIPFINDIIRSFSDIIESQFKNVGNPSKQIPLKNFTYDAIKQSLGKKYNLTSAIRQYRINRMRKPLVLGYESWYIGAVNNDNFFFGGNITQAQELYYKNI
jgi:hypothetical protein